MPIQEPFLRIMGLFVTISDHSNVNWFVFVVKNSFNKEDYESMSLKDSYDTDLS